MAEDIAADLLDDPGKRTGSPGAQPVVVSSLFADVGGAPYTDYKIDTRNEIDDGILMIPIAGKPGTPPKIVRRHAGAAVKRVQWTAERVGLKPVCPHWDTGNANEKVAARVITPMSPLLVNDRVQAWRCSGLYTYYIAAASDGLSRFAAGAPIPDRTPPESNIIEVSQFSKVVLRSPY